jgi:hypothetical protein
MATASVLDPASLPSPALRPRAGGLSLFGLLDRWLRPSSFSAAEEALIGDLMRAARILGAPLLDATERADLDDRIERALLSPEFQSFDDSAGQLLVLDIGSALPPGRLPAQLAYVLGDGPAVVVDEGGRLVVAMLSIAAQIAVLRGRPGPGATGPFAAALAGSAHSTILNAILQGARASVAFLGIAHACFEGTKLAPWLALALAQTYRDGAYEYLRLLASLPVHVPESVVPLADRYDLEALERAYHAKMAELDALPPEHESCEVP